ncbi:hypothetical protein CANARDRAFT_197473 [[Candida] arabinofermentans NRRL YB-2248]|uniref:Uncharacterized protein n=1 Tax=[Candida] arabinofermentans NRRL YB-2248 TaxID=983967 RepID=A0A1E4T2S6_9ASCO|nr:hypothetical protein CANARDRAFT_197473 [[Candida] arabinofermentans NRRL YB-2248]
MIFSNSNILLLLLLQLVSFKVYADVSIELPDSSTTYTVSDSEVVVEIELSDDGDSPSLSDAESLTFTLCTGPNTDIFAVSDLAVITPAELTDDKYNATVKASVGASGKYYIQIYAVYSSGYTIHYSDRFSLKGMTGTHATSGTGDPPDAELSASVTADMSASFSVTYTKQTGRTRYAPMQTQPGTKVTHSTWSRRFPSSSVSYYSTAKPSPNVYSTITPGWSYTMSSLANYATPAPFPSEVGWYAASARLQSASIDSSLRKMKKRRWDD